MEQAAKSINIYVSNGAKLHVRGPHSSYIWPAIKHSKVCVTLSVCSVRPLSSDSCINEKEGMILI